MRAEIRARARGRAQACFTEIWASHGRYPEASVILTVRSSGEEWATSVLATIGRMGNILSRPPYSFLPFFHSFKVMNDWMWEEIGAPIDPELGTPRHEQLVRAHDAWTERVKKDVPASHLMVYNVKEGWDPLCHFITPISHNVAMKCADMVHDGVEFPRLNDATSMQVFMFGLQAITLLTLAAPLLLVWWLVKLARTPAEGFKTKHA